MWSFLKTMTGKGTDPTPDGRPINNNDMATNDLSEKSEVFLNHFSSAHSTGIPNNTTCKEIILRKVLAKIKKQCSREGPGKQQGA
ncbi:hypothetical protein OUZ56_026275 [Daphnia magna]|uniref:Uncharacterized protein n=1 Tax=Daphnia magna TaxID=35525 RepID=A0ABQ9ZLA4_9CRUS|nr:hypothetical protein OUZ56_026275 [Daphnia magna]